jgi:hypothetical protein
MLYHHRHYYYHPLAAAETDLKGMNLSLPLFNKRSNPSKQCLAQAIDLNNEVGVIMVAILNHSQPSTNN